MKTNKTKCIKPGNPETRKPRKLSLFSSLLRHFLKKLKNNPRTISIVGLMLIGFLQTSAYANYTHDPSGPCIKPDGTIPSRSPEQHCVDPQDLQHYYGLDRLYARGITGKKQTIVLPEVYGSPTLQRDFDHFCDTFGIKHTTLEYVYPDGPYTPTNPITTDFGGLFASEATLDVAMAHAMAPDARIVVSITNIPDVFCFQCTLDSYFRGIQMAEAKYPGAIVSISYGDSEDNYSATEVQALLKGKWHQIIKQINQSGGTIVAGSGDSGSTATNAAYSDYLPFQSINYPAADPRITAVGGTWLQIGWRWNPQGTADDYWNCVLAGTATCPDDFFNYTLTPNQNTEAVWKEDFLPAASGGGISHIFDMPLYQLGVARKPGVNLMGYRGIPDLSLNSAVDGGYLVYTSFVKPDEGYNGPHWTIFGGTSAATPLFAAMLALVDQEASDRLGKPAKLGNVNPILYNLPRCDFNDVLPQTFGVNQQVTLDDNAMYYNADVLAAFGPFVVAPVPIPGYPVLKGYDLATGLGSPKGELIVDDIAKAVILRNRLHYQDRDY